MREEPRWETGRVETAMVEGAPHIRLYGECDIATLPVLQEQVTAILQRGTTRLVFDLERTTFLDSTVLSVFLSARRKAADAGGEVILLCRPGFIRRLLSHLEMDRLMRIYSPEDWREEVAAVH